MNSSERTAYISFYLRYGTIRVYKKTLKNLGELSYIRFLVNRESFSMAIEPYDRKTQISFRVKKEMCERGRGETLLVHSKAFCRLVAAWLHWDENNSYRIPGMTLTKQQIAVFDLSKAEKIVNEG